MSIDYQLYSLFAKEPLVRCVADGYVEFALRRDYFQKTMIDVVLSEGQFQVLKFGCANDNVKPLYDHVITARTNDAAPISYVSRSRAHHGSLDALISRFDERVR